MNKRLVVALLKYFLAFGLLGWVIHKYWEPESGSGLKHVWTKHVVEGQPIHVGFLLLGAGIMTLSVLLTLLRWYFLVRRTCRSKSPTPSGWV